jgi:hypothetical protein
MVNGMKRKRGKGHENVDEESYNTSTNFYLNTLCKDARTKEQLDTVVCTNTHQVVQTSPFLSFIACSPQRSEDKCDALSKHAGPTAIHPAICTHIFGSKPSDTNRHTLPISDATKTQITMKRPFFIRKGSLNMPAYFITCWAPYTVASLFRLVAVRAVQLIGLCSVLPASASLSFFPTPGDLESPSLSPFGTLAIPSLRHNLAIVS